MDRTQRRDVVGFGLAVICLGYVVLAVIAMAFYLFSPDILDCDLNGTLAACPRPRGFSGLVPAAILFGLPVLAISGAGSLITLAIMTRAGIRSGVTAGLISLLSGLAVGVCGYQCV